ncbi:MAG: hypothetical protein CMI18_02035 [Opitutaceae bacterium]|nr:hypothetical protein [Opitutaceae bacterium]|tara:strand:- start:665 stop:1366 length:702 start_codon:yes stop_codon:yes gene_type:complete
MKMKIRNAIIVLILGILIPLHSQEIPAFIAALEETSVARLTPADAPEQWLLAHVDVETTGLVPGYHEMIDIGVIMTDLEGKEMERLFLRIMPDHPERTAPAASRVNGFSVELWEERGCISTVDAIEQLVEFHNRVAGEKDVLFVAYNAWFDISFLDHLFRSLGRTWRELYHYFILDLPSMAWSMGINDLGGQGMSDKLQVEPETSDLLKHTGITGAASNVDVYRAILRLRDRK